MSGHDEPAAPRKRDSKMNSMTNTKRTLIVASVAVTVAVPVLMALAVPGSALAVFALAVPFFTMPALEAATLG
jgi:uncharacterized membrane protein